MRFLAHLGFLTTVFGLAAVACGAGPNSSFLEAPAADGSSPASNAATSGAAGGSGSPTTSPGLFVPDASVSTPSVIDGAVTDAFVGCAATTVQAKLLPLDLYFLLDTSFSMDDLVSSGRSKWQAVTAAITTFINDPASVGLGVGVQYFPATAPGVPASCTSSAQCGAAGPCVLNICQTPASQVFPCNTDADCVLCDANGRHCQEYECAPAGECANAHDVFCSPGLDCGLDTNGFELGACEALTSSSCLASDDCVASDYQKPAVAIAPLPGNASAIAMSLAAHEPLGNTPTQAALQGVIAGAEAFASANPGHTVVVVLATDGQPDEIADNTNACTSPATAAAADTQVAQVATAGLGSNPSIKTFGIGVFTPSDIASGTMTLDQLAVAGGTTTPFIIGTAGAMNNVEQLFSSALTSIRGASLPCNYQVPVPATGDPDFSKINVQYTAADGAVSVVPYVESAGSCDSTVGGWYYNVDPLDGGVPTTIDMCPTSCETLKGDAGGRVDIALGCKTQTIIR
jgi:hypothetical protein